MLLSHCEFKRSPDFVPICSCLPLAAPARPVVPRGPAAAAAAVLAVAVGHRRHAQRELCCATRLEKRPLRHRRRRLAWCGVAQGLGPGTAGRTVDSGGRRRAALPPTVFVRCHAAEANSAVPALAPTLQSTEHCRSPSRPSSTVHHPPSTIPPSTIHHPPSPSTVHRHRPPPPSTVAVHRHCLHTLPHGLHPTEEKPCPCRLGGSEMSSDGGDLRRHISDCRSLGGTGSQRSARALSARLGRSRSAWTLGARRSRRSALSLGGVVSGVGTAVLSACRTAQTAQTAQWAEMSGSGPLVCRNAAGAGWHDRRARGRTLLSTS